MPKSATQMDEYRFSLGGDHDMLDVGFIFSVYAISKAEAVLEANQRLRRAPGAVEAPIVYLNEGLWHPIFCLNTERVLTEADICEVINTMENEDDKGRG